MIFIDRDLNIAIDIHKIVHKVTMGFEFRFSKKRILMLKEYHDLREYGRTQSP